MFKSLLGAMVAMALVLAAGIAAGHAMKADLDHLEDTRERVVLVTGEDN